MDIVHNRPPISVRSPSWSHLPSEAMLMQCNASHCTASATTTKTTDSSFLVSDDINTYKNRLNKFWGALSY